MAVLPARVRRPRDKAKVVNAVQVVQGCILARLCDRRFFSLPELNGAIREAPERLNARPLKRPEGSRLSLFPEFERAALKPLPKRPYTYAIRKKAKIRLDYHVEVERAYYSVPYKPIGQKVDVRCRARMLEIFHRRKLVAAHPSAVIRRGVLDPWRAPLRATCRGGGTHPRAAQEGARGRVRPPLSARDVVNLAGDGACGRGWSGKRQRGRTARPSHAARTLESAPRNRTQIGEHGGDGAGGVAQGDGAEGCARIAGQDRAAESEFERELRGERGEHDQ